MPYLRLQSVTDHVQPDHDHAVAMVNAAIGSDAPWVGLNTITIRRPITSIPRRWLLADSTDRDPAGMYLDALETILGHL